MLIGSLFLLIATMASAQPFSGYVTNSSGHNYIRLPQRDYVGGSFTFEAWVSLGTSSCASIAGNDYTRSIWIGVCGGTLRSYIRGGSSLYDAGTVPANDWTHIAVTFDNATKTRTHYIDGEVAGVPQVDPGPITTSTTEWRIFSDVPWQVSPSGAIDEVRFWNVARTRDQIRSTITSTINSPQPGLISVYHLDGNYNDSIDPARHGTAVGTVGILTTPVSAGCATNATTLCVGAGGRFAVNVTYKTGTTTGTAQVVPVTTAESGLFWFFGPNNWEVMVKVLNGCGFGTPRYWVFSAATTDVHYELVVTDLQRGVVKRYFNYQGNAAPAITDTGAFATCP
ncbi:MAG TPA: LamG domain-containing protein [Thermoanaerobaculia bacterium]